VTTQSRLTSVMKTTACGGIVHFTLAPLISTGKSKTASCLLSSSGFPVWSNPSNVRFL
jgi:hypothetical protein